MIGLGLAGLIATILQKDCRCGHSVFDHSSGLANALVLGYGWRPCRKKIGFMWRKRCECAHYGVNDWEVEGVK